MLASPVEPRISVRKIVFAAGMDREPSFSVSAICDACFAKTGTSVSDPLAMAREAIREMHRQVGPLKFAPMACRNSDGR